MQGGSRCPERAVEPERARWHDPVLGRWLGLTPEQPALCLRGFPGRLRVALSRVSDPPGLGRRQGAQRAARGTIREKRYNLPHPGVHHTQSSHSSSERGCRMPVRLERLTVKLTVESHAPLMRIALCGGVHKLIHCYRLPYALRKIYHTNGSIAFREVG